MATTRAQARALLLLLLLFSSAPLLPDAATTTKQKIAVVYRDFTAGHPDFGRTPKFPSALVEGCVWNSLNAAGKPVLRPECLETAITTVKGSSPLFGIGKMYTNASNFDMWYADSTPSVNGVLEFIGEEKSVSNRPVTMVYEYESEAFHPLKGAGCTKSKADETFNYDNYNYLFTTELTLDFEYQGGESYYFKGDDDVWVFINGKLALDLGGTHRAIGKEINLDTLAAKLGIVKSTPGNARYVWWRVGKRARHV